MKSIMETINRIINKLGVKVKNKIKRILKKYLSTKVSINQTALGQKQRKKFKDYIFLIIVNQVEEASEKDYFSEANSVKVRYANSISQMNTILKEEEFDYAIFMEKNDKIYDNFIAKFNEYINLRGKVSFIYCDEVRDNKNHYKPEYSPHTLLGYNYIGKATAYEKKLLEQIGFLDEQYKVAWNFDLNLKASECAGEIGHISEILFEGKYVGSNEEIAVLKNALERRGKKGEVVKTSEEGAYTIKYCVNPEHKVSILIPTRDYAEVLETCLESIYNKTNYENYEIIIIDNGSCEQATLDLFDRYKEKYDKRFKVLTLDIPFNYPKLNNEAVKVAEGDYVLLLNNDTKVIDGDWLEILLGYAELDNVGAVSPVLLFEDETIQHAGVVMGIGKVGGRMFKYEEIENNTGYFNRLICAYDYTALTAACMMIKRDVYLKCGGMDEELQVTMNGIDLCLKLRDKKLYNVLLPQVKLFHYESKTRGYDLSIAKRQRANQEIAMLKKNWGNRAKVDPFYNKNLSKSLIDFSEKHYFGERVETRISKSIPLNMEYNIDVLKVENNIIEIFGWGFIANEPAENTKVFIELVDKKNNKYTYSARKVRRLDVDRKYNESLDRSYEWSGFMTSIKLEDLVPSKYTINIIFENTPETNYKYKRVHSIEF